jgi:hypothetical protein
LSRFFCTQDLLTFLCLSSRLISCLPGRNNTEFALNSLQCGLNHSFLINLYYTNDTYPVGPGSILTGRDVKNQPIIELNSMFLSKVNYISFVVILIDPAPKFYMRIYWIRYFSLLLEVEYDICHYKPIRDFINHTEQKILFLYATNSSQMMIRAKTICNKLSVLFQLIDYVAFIHLKLLASTHFFIMKEEEDDEQYDE